MEIPKDEIEAHIDQLLEADSWFQAAIRVVVSGPPSGDVEQNRETLDQMAREFPLQALFPKVHLGRDRLPHS